MLRTPLAWLTPQHFNLACLKYLIPILMDYLTFIAFLFIWTVFSIHVVFRLNHTEDKKSSPPDPIATYTTDSHNIIISAKRTAAPVKKRNIGPEGRRQFQVKERDSIPCSNITMAILLIFPCALLVLFHFRVVMAINDYSREREHPLYRTLASPPSRLQEVFQVYQQPVSFASHGSDTCDEEVLLMDYVFGSSYGKPFIGNYTPPSCDFDTVHINFTVTSRGKQYDRLALMYLGDVEVFRTSTAEPTTNGIVWTYIKEMSQYNTLWKEPQTIIFDLGNIINDVYTGSFNATLTARFSHRGSARTAGQILPISAKKSASNAASAFSVPSDNTTVKYTIPSSVSRAVVAISACGQSQEEFWWSNVFSEDTHSFTSTVGDLYGYSPFREVQLYIDGTLAGLVWPFPVIFTGGVAPGFWRPIVGIDAFDLRQPEIDISPFLPILQDGNEHSFEIRVTGLRILQNGTAVLAETVGSYWVVTGNIFLYTDETHDSGESAEEQDEKDAVIVTAPPPSFAVTRKLTVNATGGNDTLEYFVAAERTFTAISSKYTWSQRLSFSNSGFLNQQGYSQVNKQLTTGKTAITNSIGEPDTNETTFHYPLLVNATYGITDKTLTIDAWMKRGLQIDSSGDLALSTFTLSSGPSHIHTTQSGQAKYKSVTGSGSSSWGNTAVEYESSMGGISYERSVRAMNGQVVYDTQPVNKALSVAFSSVGPFGRGSVRSMLGRGPGKPTE